MGTVVMDNFDYWFVSLTRGNIFEDLEFCISWNSVMHSKS